MSSWRKKMRVKWNRNLDGPSSSGAVSDEPMGPFERRGSLRKPAPPAGAKEEPFKRSWSFRIGGTSAKAKDSPAGGGDKGAFLRMFRFGKDKKKAGQDAAGGKRRMSDAAATEVARNEELLSQWSSVPLDVSGSPDLKRRDDALLLRAHTLPRSLEAAPGGSECPDDADSTVCWGVIYCDPKAAEKSSDTFQLVQDKFGPLKNHDARGGKVFSNAVLPHFLPPGQDGAGEPRAEKRPLKKLLLNGACPQGGRESSPRMGNGVVISNEVDAKERNPAGSESAQDDSGVVSATESNEGKPQTTQCPMPIAPNERCEDEDSLDEQCPESAGNAAFVVEVNECYQDECEEAENSVLSSPSVVPRPKTVEGSQVGAEEGEVPLHEREQPAYDGEPTLNGIAPTDCERSSERQRHDSVSTDSNCEECPAQDEFEFVAAEPAKREMRRVSRDTVSPVSDVSDEFPFDEKASFIFLKPDSLGESLQSPLSTPDDEPPGGLFSPERARGGDDDDVLMAHFGDAICHDSEVESVDLNDPEEKEVIIVDHLPCHEESPHAPDVCVISSDMIQSVNCETFVLQSEAPPGACSNGSLQETALTETVVDVHAEARQSKAGVAAESDVATLDMDEQVVEGNSTEASESSFQDKVHFFNAIGSPQNHHQAAHGGSRRPRTSRIPTASRLPRPTARQAKKDSGIPVLSAPVPAKRSRVGAVKVGHIPQPSRNGSGSQQQRQVTPPLTRVTASPRDCSAGTKMPSFSGTVKNAKHAQQQAAAAERTEAPKAPAREAPGQLKRSNTFVLDESEQSTETQSASQAAPEAVGVQEQRSTRHQASGRTADSVQKGTTPVSTKPAGRDAAMKADPCAVVSSVQVPVVDSTDRASPSDGDDDGVCSSCNAKKAAATGASSRLSAPGGPASKAGEARVQAQTKAEFTREIQRLGALCESRTKELTMLKMQLRHASIGFSSFGVIIQHLSAQNDSFCIPKLSEELQKSQEEIERARVAIEEYKNNIEEVKRNQEQEIEALKAELEGKHALKIQELEAAHKNELTCYLESHTRKLEEMKAFYTDIIEGDRKSHEETLDSLKQRHREKIDAINEEYSLQLDSIHEDHQARQRELDARHEALLQQHQSLQQKANEFQESVLLDTDAKIQWLSKKNAELVKEVESLNVVLEMRANQIQSLQRSTVEKERKEEELDRCKAKMEKMKARIEDLQELLNEKVKLQSQLSVENAKLRETSEKQNRQLSRLDMHNEELKYKLRESVNSSMLGARARHGPAQVP